MSFLKKTLHSMLPNPFFQLLKQAKKKQTPKFLILWNRGLGDIALGLYALCEKIRESSPDAEITFLTRKDLSEAFKLLKNIKVVEHKSLKRGETRPLHQLAQECHLEIKEFDFCIEKIDTSRWLSWQIGNVTPMLYWNAQFDQLSDKFKLIGKNYIGAHVSSETGQYYGYEKNWPKEKFYQLFTKIKECSNKEIVLFGVNKDLDFNLENVIDLRGKTTVFEMLSIMKNHCTHFIAPDSGILSLVYYLDVNFPLKMISLWSDPNQGVLRQEVESPNPGFEHYPIKAPEQNLKNVRVAQVFNRLELY